MAKALTLFSALVLSAAHVGQGQVLTPSSNWTVPDNGTSNVTYSCTIPTTPGLLLFWEINSVQLQTLSIREAFANLGIFVQNGPNSYESTLIVSSRARANFTTIPVQCLYFNSEDQSSVFSAVHYVNTYGPPETPLSIDVTPHTQNTLIITWKAAVMPSWVPVTYTVLVSNLTASPATAERFTTNSSTLTYVERELNCHKFNFEVFAFNEAGESGKVHIEESIPLSPDFTNTTSSLTVDYVDVSSPAMAKISVSFQRAMECSTRFLVSNHSVQVVGGDGSVVTESTTTSLDRSLQLVVIGIPRDAQFSVRVQACNNITCRRTAPLNLLTTDVQSSFVLFFETHASINCTYGRGSLARGCVVTLQVEEGMVGKEGREEFRLTRDSVTAAISKQCVRTQNSITAYQVVKAVDWESDGSLGSYSIPVATNETDNERDFPCSIDRAESEGLSAGAIAGIVVGSVLFVLGVTLLVVVIVFCVYHHTREVKKKGPGEISIETRSLLGKSLAADSSEPLVTRDVVNPLSSVPKGAKNVPPTSSYPSSTLKSTASTTQRSLQTSLAYGPVCELSMQKEGKLRMKFRADTLRKCKESGRKKFHLLPLMDSEEEGEEGRAAEKGGLEEVGEELSTF